MATAVQIVPDKVAPKHKEAMAGAYFWLTAFYLVYCARPEDWIPGLKYAPLAKIAGIFAFLGLLLSIGKSKRGFKHLPKEALYLLLLIGLLFFSAMFSPVWKGGAFFRTLDFAKVYVAWVLTLLVVTNFERLRRVIYIQAGSVAVISVVTVLKGRSHYRLTGVLGGIYSNPNDLAFAIVLSIPLCLAFFLCARGALRKLVWVVCMLCMATALFQTASRGGFITLIVSGAVCLWHFAVKGRRMYLAIIAVLVAVIVGAVAGKGLRDRFFAISGEDLDTRHEFSAYNSYEERQELMKKALEAMVHYPILGIGMRNFTNYSGHWREVHMSYLQIGAEGGFPGLILYVLFFASGFANLRKLRRTKNLDPEIVLFVGALHSSLVGFVVGAFFSPEAYQYFPYFAVAYTAVLLMIVKEGQGKKETVATNPPATPANAETGLTRRRTSPEYVSS
jgi:O-antigen ligase